MDYQTEFDKQIKTLLDLEYPKCASLTNEQFVQKITPLRKHLDSLPPYKFNIAKGFVPFVIVITNKLIPEEAKMTKVSLYGKFGLVKLKPHTSKDFSPIDSLDIPDTSFYLLVGIQRGKKYLNVRPCDALIDITKRGRTPLTIDEGIAILTQYPEFLVKNNCFSLLGSRNQNDKRVPAIWINSKKEPNLGWCWGGNPHTWLGSASALERVNDWI